MEALQTEAHKPIAQRTQRVLEAFQKATPEMKAKVFELAQFPVKSEHVSDGILCQWDQAWDQNWPQWDQRLW